MKHNYFRNQKSSGPKIYGVNSAFQNSSTGKTSHSPAKLSRAYLETAALIHFAGRDDGPQKEMYRAIISLLSDAELVTGRFVIFEMMFGYLANVEFVYAKLKISNNMEDFLLSLNTGNLAYQPRKRQTFQVIQNWLQSRFFESGTNIASWEDFQYYALNAVRLHYRSVLRKGKQLLRVNHLNCHPEFDDYKGDLDESGFLKTPNKNCEDQEYDCGLASLRSGQSFRKMRRGCRLCRIHNKASPNSEEGKRFQAVLAVENANAEEVMITDRCRQMGDAIVALDCPPDFCLVTPNKKHYDDICGEMGIPLRAYSKE